MGRHWAHRQQLVGDVVLTAALCAFGLWEVVVAPLADSVVQGPTELNVATVLLTTLPVVGRRWAPLPAAALVAAGVGLRPLVADPLELFAPVLAMVVLAYSVAAYGSRVETALAAALFVAAIAVASARGTGTDASPDFVPSVTVLLTVGAVGRVAHVRQSRAQTIERRAIAREKEVEREIAEATAAERRQIARELHDVVSHSLAVIIMQAGGAQSVLASDPDRAQESLGAIERVARQGLVEMRRLLDLLGDPELTMTPRPSLAALDTLVCDARLSGLDVELTVRGAIDEMAPALDMSAYRIVQEALTNAIRHGGRCRAEVTVTSGPDGVELEVTTDRTLRASSVAGSRGRGLIGMRERVQLLGGEFDAGPVGDGFRVRATLPFKVSP